MSLSNIDTGCILPGRESCLAIYSKCTCSTAQWLKTSFEWISINFILVLHFCLLYYLQTSLSGIIHWNQVYFLSDLLLKGIFLFVCKKLVPWVGRKALLCLEFCWGFASWTLWSLGLGILRILIWEFPALQKYRRHSKLKKHKLGTCAETSVHRGWL